MKSPPRETKTGGFFFKGQTHSQTDVRTDENQAVVQGQNPDLPTANGVNQDV